MRMRKKPNLPARMEKCKNLLPEDPKGMKGKWQTLFPEAKEIWLELGAGKGRFTAEMAQKHPEVLYVAVERVPDAMVVAMEKVEEMSLTNVFFIDGDAALLQEYFEKEEISRLFVNFCDPWPGQKHARRRLIHANFLSIYRRVLRVGGEVEFKTDNKDLFEFSLFQFPKVGYELSDVTRNLHENGILGIMTDYEEKFHLQGLPIHRCVGKKLFLEEEPEIVPIYTTAPPEN
ncbi:MAG: tRNA (guanosine(46)-N7)-methyltransferase TrmB [Eubacteriales bacterium]